MPEMGAGFPGFVSAISEQYPSAQVEKPTDKSTRDLSTEVSTDQMQAQINPGSAASGSQNISAINVQNLWVHLSVGAVT